MHPILDTIFWILVGCGANPKVSSHLSIPTGSSKEFTCEQYVLICKNVEV